MNVRLTVSTLFVFAFLSSATIVAQEHQQDESASSLRGEKDWNVPVQNSEQLYLALRRRGITTQLVVYPGEHHGGWTMPHQKDYLERRLAWYDQYVKGKTSPAP